jgi:hypothetical protein
MKWVLWNDGVEMANFGMTTVEIGLFRQSLTSSEAELSRRQEGRTGKNLRLLSASRVSFDLISTRTVKGWIIMLILFGAESESQRHTWNPWSIN